MKQRTADEAHMPHQSELQHWVSALEADFMLAVAHIPSHIDSLLRLHGLVCACGHSKRICPCEKR